MRGGRGGGRLRAEAHVLLGSSKGKTGKQSTVPHCDHGRHHQSITDPFPSKSGWGFSTHSSRPLPNDQRPEWAFMVTRECTPGPVESESQLSHLLGVCPPSGNRPVGLWPGREGVSDESTLNRLSVSSLLGSGARELGQKLLRSLGSVL